MQGLEFEVVFVWHPLAGLPEADGFYLDPGPAVRALDAASPRLEWISCPVSSTRPCLPSRDRCKSLFVLCATQATSVVAWGTVIIKNGVRPAAPSPVDPKGDPACVCVPSCLCWAASRPV